MPSQPPPSVFVDGTTVRRATAGRPFRVPSSADGGARLGPRRLGAGVAAGGPGAGARGGGDRRVRRPAEPRLRLRRPGLRGGSHRPARRPAVRRLRMVGRQDVPPGQRRSDHAVGAGSLLRPRTPALRHHVRRVRRRPRSALVGGVHRDRGRSRRAGMAAGREPVVRLGRWHWLSRVDRCVGSQSAGTSPGVLRTVPGVWQGAPGENADPPRDRDRDA